MVRRSIRTRLIALALIGVAAFAVSAQAATGVVPTGWVVLRATYIAQNPVQAFVDPVSGRVRGPAVDITRALAQQLGVPWTISGAPGATGVIAGVASGAADIGFVAIDPLRAVEVDFSTPYSLSQNAYLVAANSPLRSASEVDAANVRIGVRKGDAGEFFLTRTLGRATLVREEKGNLEDAARQLRDGALSAYAANRHRLTEFAANNPTYRILDGNFYAVEQAIAVRKGDTAMLSVLNAFLLQARESGFIASSIADAGLKGVDVAP